MDALDAPARTRRFARYLLLVAGLGGLLYGIDVGIIAGALPYLEATAVESWHLGAQDISFIVAAVLLGSVGSSLGAGVLADLIGRKRVMLLAGALFVASIPIIALAAGYTPLFAGRLLQGTSGGLIGVVVPLYLAECLGAESRGRGTGIFQLLLTIGLVVAALIGLYYAREVDAVTRAAAALADPTERAARVFAARDGAWRHIFWMSITPGIAFTLGVLALPESPRWLVQRGRREEALRALLRTRTKEAAERELAAMLVSGPAAERGPNPRREPLLRRKYVVPFVLACVILACNQATGVNSILAYVVNIFNQAGLPGAIANWGDVLLKSLNALMTVAAVALVDRRGRKFLLMLGSGGIVLSLAGAGTLFLLSERQRVDVQAAFAPQATGDGLSIMPDRALLTGLATQRGLAAGHPVALTVAYRYGPFSGVESRRSDEPAPRPIQLTRAATVQPDSVIGALFRRLHLNPFPDPEEGARAPFALEQVLLGPVPDLVHGWLVALCIFGFMAFFAVGPGVCVWLALSELMPTRIRSNGMSIALLVNQFVSTVIAAVFLPVVGRHGYSSMFFFWAGCTVIYFLTAALFLPETKGKTLEEIEAHFDSSRRPA